MFQLENQPMPADPTQTNSTSQLENQPRSVQQAQGNSCVRPLVDAHVRPLVDAHGDSEFDAILGEVTEIWQGMCKGQHPMEALREALKTKAAKLNFCKTIKSAMIAAHPDFMTTITTLVNKAMLETYHRCHDIVFFKLCGTVCPCALAVHLPPFVAS